MYLTILTQTSKGQRDGKYYVKSEEREDPVINFHFKKRELWTNVNTQRQRGIGVLL